MGLDLVDALAEIHAVDWRACGLEGYGKPTGYLERQLRRFNGLWEHNKTRELPRVQEVARLARRQHARVARGDDRARRLPARQHDGRRRCAGAPDRDLRLGAVDDRRPARRPRLPDRHLGRSPATPTDTMYSSLSAVTRARGLPDARRADRPLRGAHAAARCRTCAGTRRWRSGRRRCSWRATTSARSPARPTTRILKLFDEGVPALAEAAYEVSACRLRTAA